MARPQIHADSRACRKAIAKRNRNAVAALKEASPCTDCKQYYPHYVMQYDHLRDKKNAVSRLAAAYSMEVILKEIEKCELVCANCHMIRTHKRRVSIASDAPVL